VFSLLRFQAHRFVQVRKLPVRRSLGSKGLGQYEIEPPSVMAWFSTKQEPQLVGNQIGVGLTKGTVEWLQQPGNGLAGLRLSSDRVVNGPRAQGTAVAPPVRPREKVRPE